MLQTIKFRVLAGYAAVLICTFIAAIILLSANRKVSVEVNNFVSHTLPTLKTLDSIHNDSKQLVLFGYSLYGFTLDSEAFTQQKNTFSKTISNNISQLQQLKTDNLDHSFSLLMRALNSLGDTMSAPETDWDQARDDLQKLNQSANNFNIELVAIRDLVQAKATEGSSSIASDLNTSKMIVIALVVVLVLVVVGGFVLAQKQIASPIAAMAIKLNKLSNDRDLVSQLPPQATSELSLMTQSIEGLLAMFRHGMGEVKHTISGIGEAVEQLIETTDESGNSVVELKNGIHHLVNLMDDLESDMSENLACSHSAAQAAIESAEQVDKGRAGVEETAKAISGLETDIKQTASMLDTLKSEGNNVSTVVETIAQIAEQTNLLALNAAIEAARAGESGRGFAVVADEVRTLAVRTHQSTVEINAMLEKIVSSINSAVSTMDSNRHKASSSVELATSLVETLESGRTSILSLVDVSRQAADIANNSKAKTSEAKSGVEAFSSIGVALVDGSENIQTAAGNLSTLASGLTANVRQFKLD